MNARARKARHVVKTYRAAHRILAQYDKYGCMCGRHRMREIDPPAIRAGRQARLNRMVKQRRDWNKPQTPA